MSKNTKLILFGVGFGLAAYYIFGRRSTLHTNIQVKPSTNKALPREIQVALAAAFSVPQFRTVFTNYMNSMTKEQAQIIYSAASDTDKKNMDRVFELAQIVPPWRK